MSESLAGSSPPFGATDVDTPLFGAPLPRRVMRARREAAEARAQAAAEWTPSWAVAPAAESGPVQPRAAAFTVADSLAGESRTARFGAAVSLDDDLI